MSNRLIPLKPQDVAARLAARKAVLVDIREPDEFAQQHVPGALSHPLGGVDPEALRVHAPFDVVFTCRSGMRTGAYGERLARCAPGPAYVLQGGVDAWAAAGLPVAAAGRQG